MATEQTIEKQDKQTCLYDKHLALGALMSPFGGFTMPIQYAGIAPEHMAVREKVGLFDVSHMGEVIVRGKDAERYVQHIFTNDIAGAPVGKIYYGMMCYEDGGTVDDLLVYKMGDNDFFLVINASNIDKDWAWMQQHAAGFNIDLQNKSDYYGQIAVQGPESEHIVETVLGLPCSELAFYTVKTVGDVIVPVQVILVRMALRFMPLTTISASAGTNLLLLVCKPVDWVVAIRYASRWDCRSMAMNSLRTLPLLWLA